MKWWKRVFFSLLSLIGGFFSLDYQVFAFGLLTKKEGRMPEGLSWVPWQLVGAGMFLLYGVVLAGYFYLVWRNASFLPTYEGEEKKKNWKGPRMELLLQSCFLFTGLLLRFGYLLCIYLPNQLLLSMVPDIRTISGYSLCNNFACFISL